MFSKVPLSWAAFGLALATVQPALAQEAEIKDESVEQNTDSAAATSVNVAPVKEAEEAEKTPATEAESAKVPTDEVAPALCDDATEADALDAARSENALLKEELNVLKGDVAKTAAAKKAEVEAAAKAEEEAKKAEGPHPGFNWNLKLGANASFLHSQSVVGQQDGLTLSVGGMVAGGMLYLRGDHRWDSKFNVQHLQTVTPLLPVPVKAVDLVDMSTEYRWALPFAKWIGPYARAQAVTAALPGQLVRNKETLVRRNFSDGTVEDETIGLDANGVSVIPLTGFLEPLVINENAGVNLIALEKKWLTLKTRLGAGGQHIIVQNGFILASSDDTSTTLKQLNFANSAGVNADFEAAGAVWKDSIAYSLVARFYYPVLTLEESDLDAVERINADITGSLSFKVNDLMSINYVLTIKRVPSILNDLQVQNALLLNFALQLI